MTRVRSGKNALNVADVQLKWTAACVCREFARWFKTVNVFMEVQQQLAKWVVSSQSSSMLPVMWQQTWLRKQ